MFLTLQDFLGYFPNIQISKKDFVDKFTITYSRPLTLANAFSLGPIGNRPPIIKSSTDLRYIHQKEVIDYFYEIVIVNRHYYLTKFYESFFAVPDPRDYKWSGDIRMNTSSANTNKKNSININVQDLTRSLSIQKNDKSRIMVRNLFHKEILDETKVTNTVKAKVSFWQTLDNLYNHLKLEDRFFAPSSVGLFLRDKNQKGKNNIITPKKGTDVNYNNLFYLCQQYQPKASILNPYSVHWFLNNIFKGGRLFTPVLSWCSYLIAFMHSNGWTDYVGVDVMPKVCKKAELLADYYHKLDAKEFGHKKVEVFCQPSESLLNDGKFLKKYNKWFDSIIICPAYFDMEIYSEGEQSIKNYPVYDDWLEKYWHQTVQVCAKVLKPGGLFGVIANDYYSLEGIHYPLPKDFDNFTSKYFKLVETYFLYNRTSPLRVNYKDRTERLFVYTI